MVGGQNAKEIWNNDLISFDLAERSICRLKANVDSSKKKAFEPPGMQGHRSWVLGKYFYVFGGQIKEK